MKSSENMKLCLGLKVGIMVTFSEGKDHLEGVKERVLWILKIHYFLNCWLLGVLTLGSFVVWYILGFSFQCVSYTSKL